MSEIEKLENILLSDKVSDNINKNINFILDIIPELSYIIGFEHKHPHHHLDVYNHTLYALDNSPKDLEVRMALLLHDIGKPFSYQDDADIRHFRGHPQVSARISQNILLRLYSNNTFIKNVVYLVKTHDTIIDINNLDNSIDLVKKKLAVQYADAKAHSPSKVKKRLDLLEKIKEKLISKNL